MPEATTFSATVAALQELDQDAQECEQEGRRCSVYFVDLIVSQDTLNAALMRFKLDARTMAASQRLREATSQLGQTIDEANAGDRRVSEATQAALETVGQHRRLAEAVQEKGDAAAMPWYCGGR